MVNIVSWQCCQFCSEHYRLNVIGGLCNWLFTVDLGLFCKNLKVCTLKNLWSLHGVSIFPVVHRGVGLILWASHSLYCHTVCQYIVLNYWLQCLTAINLCNVRLTPGCAKAGNWRSCGKWNYVQLFPLTIIYRPITFMSIVADVC